MTDSMPSPAAAPQVQGFFDKATNTVSYIVHDPATREAAALRAAAPVTAGAADAARWRLTEPPAEESCMRHIVRRPLLRTRQLKSAGSGPIYRTDPAVWRGTGFSYLALTAARRCRHARQAPPGGHIPEGRVDGSAS